MEVGRLVRVGLFVKPVYEGRADVGVGGAEGAGGDVGEPVLGGHFEGWCVWTYSGWILILLECCLLAEVSYSSLQCHGGS